MGAPRRIAALLALVALATACTGSSGPGTSPSTTSGSPSPSAAPSQSPNADALVASLPAGCQAALPASTATIAFVAEGRAWAVGPDGKGLTCLFEASDPGPFAWGPRSDRVLLGGLAVRGVGSTASRSPGDSQPSIVSWGRPTGKAVAFVDPGATKIEKALIGKQTVLDVSPFDNVTYQDVVYHPSGLALAMVLTDSDGSSIWVSSNTGKDPKRIVWSKEQTIFGPVAWRMDGDTLYYAAHLKNGTTMIAGADLRSKRVNAGLWVGKQDVLRLAPAPNGEAIGLDAGTGCDARTALLSNLDQKGGQPFLRNAPGRPPSSVGSTTPPLWWGKADARGR